MGKEDLSWEEEVQKVGKDIFHWMGEETPSVFRKDWWSGKVMEWCMRDTAFKIQMFRFVDVLPSLKSSRNIGRHVKEYFSQPGVHLSPALQWTLGSLATNPLTSSITAGRIKKNVEEMARRFIVASTPEEAFEGLKKTWDQGLAFTIDLLGEATVSEAEASVYEERYMELFDVLAPKLAAWPSRDTGRENEFPRFNVSIKLSSLYPHMDPANFEGSVDAVKERLRPIFRKAAECGAFINIDMEHHGVKDLTLAIFKSLLEEDEFADAPKAGIVIQMYLKEARKDLQDLIMWARERDRPITVRLVKGAYWDYEQAVAKLNDWPIPVFLNKWETDAAYEEGLRLCLESYPLVHTAIASHNVRSLAYGIVCANRLAIPVQGYEIQALYGMAEPIKKALLKLGYNVCEYIPIGELLPGMSYFVRRLLENTSNESFLVQSFEKKASVEDLLKKPKPPSEEESTMREKTRSESEVEEKKQDTGVQIALKPYHPEPVRDFSIAEQRIRFQEAVEKVKKQPSREHVVSIGGKPISKERELLSVNPANPKQVVGKTYPASKEDAERAVAQAKEAALEWRDTPPEERAEVLLKVAEIYRKKRDEISALQILEVGKTWAEADGDVCEAIDFCEYYAREMIRLGTPRLMDPLPGETNEYFYQPRGVALVVAPWNFPLAITTGMTMAALVTGNAVIYKPSSISPMVGAEMAKALEEAQLPQGVFQYLPAAGGKVGSLLVENPDVDMIAFTGSREVGIDIIQRAAGAARASGAQSIKKVVAEMGGKNAIIVDEDADLDAAVVGVVRSAFGFQGQKCSACSRAIVLEENYDRFKERLIEATRSLIVGDPSDPGVHVGPVVDAQAQLKILDFIRVGKAEGTLLFQTDAPEDGYYVGPAVFEDIRPHHRLAQEEIFGPVLALMRAEDMDEALEIANGTDYALTGGLYSRSPETIARVRKEFRVGNLYINRKITGAIVGRQPFGGFKMSGIGSKAGGPDYLLQFMEPRTVTENTIRKGFTPELGND